MHSELCQKLEIQQSAGSVGIPLCPYISTCMFASQWEYAQLFFHILSFSYYNSLLLKTNTRNRMS